MSSTSSKMAVGRDGALGRIVASSPKPAALALLLPFLIWVFVLAWCLPASKLKEFTVTWVALSSLTDVVVTFFLAVLGLMSVRVATLWAGSFTISAGFVLLFGPVDLAAAPLICPFILVVPGLIWLARVECLRFEELVVFSIALSLAIDIAGASVLALLGFWSPRAGFALLILVMLVGVIATKEGVVFSTKTKSRRTLRHSQMK